ncbi:ATP-binding cassette, sub-family F, member 2, partial [Haematococcus lacustris]
MSLKGGELISDCSIELTIGRRYGLIGQNGCGKTNFLQCLANREVPIPDHMDLYHLRTEAEPSDRTALEAVIDHVRQEMERLQKLEEHIMETVGPEDERLEALYERLEELDPTTFESRAAGLLHGLGFTKPMMEKMTKDMSGGWRMRVALARRERTFAFQFPSCEKVPPPVLPFENVDFSYSGDTKNLLYKVGQGGGGGSEEAAEAVVSQDDRVWFHKIWVEM